MLGDGLVAVFAGHPRGTARDAAGARVVLGDAVNVAVRLEALGASVVPVPAAGARILLDGAMAEWLDQTVRLATLGRLPLDGRVGPVEVARLDPAHRPAETSDPAIGIL